MNNVGINEQYQQRPKILAKLQKKANSSLISPPVLYIQQQQKLHLQEEQFGQSDTEIEVSEKIQTRVLHPTLLNKSSIHCVNYSDSYLTQIPILPPKIQKLELSINLLQSFPQGLPNLKQLNISSNKIRRLPDNLSQSLPCLRIIKANNNNIAVIPYLSQIRHLQLLNNPIKLISTKLGHSRLQVLEFDWIPYLINTIFFYANPQRMITDHQEILYTLYDLIQKTLRNKVQGMTSTQETAFTQDGVTVDFKVNASVTVNANINVNVNEEIINKEFVQFDMLFRCSRNNGLTIQFLLHHAVKNSSDFFIDFLKCWHGGINYNAMEYAGKLIIQQVLEKKYNKALQLFQIRKSNLSEPQIYIANLVLSCRYNSIEFFNYLTKNGLKRHIIQQNNRQIIETIMKNFDEELQSGEMLKKILQISGFNSTNNQFLFTLPDFDIKESEGLADSIIYILKDKDNLEKYFNFDYTQESIREGEFSNTNADKEPLLHFAMNIKKPQLVKLILQKYKKPFVRSSTGKAAKTIRGSMFSRKLVWKYQKKMIKNQFEGTSQEILQAQKASKSQMRKSRFLEIFYSRDQIDFIDQPISQEEGGQFTKINNFTNMKKKSGQIITNLLQQDLDQRKQMNNKNERLRKLISSPFKSPLKSPQKHMISSPPPINPLLSRSSNQKMLNLHPKVDNFTLYQHFHKNQLQSYAKDYFPPRAPIQPISFYSPFYICRDVDLKQDSKQAEFYEVIPNGTIAQGFKFRQTPHQEHCMNLCVQGKVQNFEEINSVN